MYFTRILLTVLIFAPLTLAATTSTARTTAGKTNAAGKSTKTPATGSKTKTSTPKDGISLRVGENQGTGSGKIITTRLGSDGNPSEQCQCTLFYLCDQADVVTVETGNAEQCPESSNVCCRVPIAWTTSEPGISPGNPDPVVDPLPNPGPGIDPQPQPQPPIDGGTGQTNCICVPSHQCTDQLAVSAGAGLIDPRFSCVSPDICCPPDSISGGATGYTPTQAPFNPSPTPTQPPYVNPNPNPVTQFPPIGSTVTPGECGIRYPSTSNRISAPDHLAETSFGEFPWMALLLTTETGPDGSITENVFVCGASIISQTIVLTAAHCVHNKVPEALRVRAGEYNTHQGASEPLIHQDRQVDRISVPNEFNPRVLFNDVALVRVSEPFDFAPHINPICSPILNTQFDFNSYNPSNCLATGWGKNAFNIGEFQTRLKRVDLTLIEQNECQNRLRSTRLGQQFNLHPSFICAGGQQGFDTCQGDGGGPLVCATNENPNKYVQVGIISWGIGCASDIPGVYASVYANREWLGVEYNSLSVFRIDTSSRIGSSSKGDSSSKGGSSSKAGSNSKAGSSSKPSSNSTRT